MHTRMAIIGSGPAGYTAAIYGARAMLGPILIAGFEPGGQLMTTTDVENYPGFADPIGGPLLMEQMMAQAVNVGTELVADIIVQVDLERRPFCLYGESGTLYTADSLVIATGAKAKWLELPSEAQFKGLGVSACATCDGFPFKDKAVAVIGGGNTAVEEALYMTNIAAKVTLVHRRDQLRAEKVLQDRLFSNPKVTMVWNHEVIEIGGTAGGVNHVMLRHANADTVTKLPVDGVFVAIGHHPATDLFVGQLELRANGYIKTVPGSTVTSVPGVFAAGDVADDIFRQAVTAAGFGCMAALEAERWLSIQH